MKRAELSIDALRGGAAVSKKPRLRTAKLLRASFCFLLLNLFVMFPFAIVVQDVWCA